MDYLDRVDLTRYVSWDTFQQWRGKRRLILATTKAALPYTGFAFDRDDLILVGRESAGVPEEVHAAATAGVTIPMANGLRSLNVATAAAMILGEALRQTDGFAPASRLL